MAPVKSFFNGFLSLVLLFLHLGCFTFFPNPNPNPDQQSPPKRRKITPLSPSPHSSASSLKPPKSLSLSIRSYLNHLFSFRKTNNNDQTQQPPIPPISTPSPLQSLTLSPDVTAGKSPSRSDDKPDISSDHATKRSSFAPRTDIFPCAACGEVLSKPHLLDLHQATRHAPSELRDGDSGKNIVQIIFHSGWKGKAPVIHRILKIHNTPRTLTRFEEYREMVRSRAARQSGRRGGTHERCIADGNERLRFYCSPILCSLGPGVCGSPYCSTCGIVRHGFTGKQVDLDGIATHGTSWGAHMSLPEDLEEEFAFMHVRRAMLVCRVVAGRVACGGVKGEGEQEEEKGVFDSVVPVSRMNLESEEELLVFNPRAVLPCFVIIYTA